MHFVPVLHGLRGLAAMAVLLYHWEGSYPGLSLALKAVPFLGTEWDLLFPVRFGWIGVDWFFVLSGFLLAGNLWRSEINGPMALRFWQRRFLRIYPGVWAQLAILLLLLEATGMLRNFSAWQAVGNALLWLYPMPGGVNPYNGVYWTLPLELSFYLLLPALLLVMRRLSVWQFLALCLVVSAAWRLTIAGLHQIGSSWAISLMFIRNVLPGMLFVFAAGMAIHHFREPLTRVKARHTWLLALVAVQVGFMYAFAAKKGTALQDDVFLLLAELALALVIAATLALLLDPPRGLRWLASAPLVWLGEVSFGIYLWHFPIQRLMPKYFQNPWWGTPEGSFAALLICLALTLPLAAASFFWIEQPALRRFSRRGVAVPDAPTP